MEIYSQVQIELVKIAATATIGLKIVARGKDSGDVERVAAIQDLEGRNSRGVRRFGLARQTCSNSNRATRRRARAADFSRFAQRHRNRSSEGRDVHSAQSLHYLSRRLVECGSRPDPASVP